MKEFCLKILLFLVGLMLLDVASGFAFRYLVKNAKGGNTALANYIADNMLEECIILGSSRGKHHYDPNIIGDSLGMSCWNCSLDAHGIILMYGRYRMLSERYVPKVLIYDVHSVFDLTDGDNHKHLGYLRYFYDYPGVDSIFWAVDGTERYKMMSQMYRYNSKWIQLISDNIHPLQNDDKGYRPIDGTMDYEPKKNASANKNVYHYDSQKMAYLEKLIVDCKNKGTKLVFTISPIYNDPTDEVFAPLKSLCTRYNVPLINHYCDKRYAGRREFFYDSMHMNKIGATEFSQEVASEVKSLISR